MKDAPANGPVYAGSEAASRGRSPGRLPAGARRGGAAAAGGRPPPLACGLAACGAVDAWIPYFPPAACGGSCGLTDAGGAAPWASAVRGDARLNGFGSYTPLTLPPSSREYTPAAAAYA